MTYLRSLFLNFLVVFFANRVVPGIDVGSFEGVTNVGGDIFFSIILGFLNSLIFPSLVVFDMKLSITNMVIGACFLSFGCYGVVALTHWGIEYISFGGWFLAGLVVSTVSFYSNYLEMKHSFSNKR